MTRRLLISSMMMFLFVSMVPLSYAQTCTDFSTASDYTDRVITHFTDGDYQAALDDASCAIELDSSSEIYFANRGIVYIELAEFDFATEDFKSAEAINPNYEPVYYGYGYISYEKGDYQDALTQFEHAQELAPDEAGTHLALAWTHISLGDGLEHEEFARWILGIRVETVPNTLTGSIQDTVISMLEGKVYSYAFDGVAGQVISVAARADLTSEVDPLVVLVDSSGKALMSDDDSGVNLDAVISGFVLPADDTYTLSVTHSGGETDGNILLTIDLGEADSGITQTFSTYKLFAGKKAEVYTTAGDHLNLRSAPGLNYDILSKLERGTLVTLVEGPFKADGYAWWRLRTEDGQEGWAVERVEEEQTLQLALLVGEDAIVTTGGDKLNARTGAGTANDRAFQIDDGANVTLLEAPQLANGFRWWKVRTADGQEGWVIDRFEGDRMLIPASEGS